MSVSRQHSGSGEAGKIGLLETFLIIAGFVIGASIYVMPGELYRLAGPAMALSIILAAIPAALSCIIAAQVGAAFPVDAANINMVRRLLSPTWAAIMGWSFLGCFVAAMPLVAFGFAEYLVSLNNAFAPYRTGIAISVIGLFSAVNLSGAKLAARAQTVMVMALLAVLVVFVWIAAPDVSMDHFIPFNSQGMGGILLATVPAFFAFLGFSLIVEISGEIRSPGRTIPRALAFAFTSITALYIVVAVCVTGTLSGDTLAASNAALADAAAQVAPRWTVLVVIFSALLATATTINAAILLASRETAGFIRLIQGPASDHAAIDPGLRRLAVLGTGIAGMVCCLAPEAISSYAIATVLAFLVGKSVVCLAAARLPQALGVEFEKLAFHIPPSRLETACWCLLAITAIFVVVSAQGNLPAVIALGAYLACGIIVFCAGRAYVRRRAL
jgi:APA family basic amino acid/polyamine antiporter